VTANGSPVVSTTTGAPGATAGQYSLTGFGSGSYTVSLSKTTGQNGISSNDAARIAQHVAGISIFKTNNQKVTADVSDNGTISSNDAALIARSVAGTGPPTGITSTWRFFVPPGPTYPAGSSPTSRTYPQVTNSFAGEDYIGLLMGDVSGNWVPTSERPDANRTRHSSVVVSLPDLVTATDNEVVIPVSVKGAANKEIISYEFDLRYDPAVIEPQEDPLDATGTASRGLFAVSNAEEKGLLRVVMYGPFPIDGNGVLLNLKFAAVGPAGSVSPLVFERILFNEGDPEMTAMNGQIELSRPAADQAEINGWLLDQMGQGIPKASILLTDTAGRTRSAISNGFGYYRFAGLEAGQTYTVSAESKGRTFAPLTLSVTDRMLSVDLIAGQ
jgi:hypothetical protein